MAGYGVRPAATEECSVAFRQFGVGLADSTWDAARHAAVRGPRSARVILEDALRRYVEDPAFAFAARTAQLTGEPLATRVVRLDEELWAAFKERTREEGRGVYATAEAALRVELDPLWGGR
jgi:hypothetical protein